MDLYLKVRLACGEGMSQREAARHFNISRDSVAKRMEVSVPPGYWRTAPIKRPKLDGFTKPHCAACGGAVYGAGCAPAGGRDGRA